MARDPDEGDAFVFDLVEDDAAVADGPAGLTGSAGSVGSAGSDGPGRRRRAAAQVAAVLAVVLGTGIAVDGARDHARSERMRDVEGGLSDVSSPLRETWAWSGTVGRRERVNEVAVLGDHLVFHSDGGLVALDPATGAEAWTVPLREDAECGPMVSPVWSDPVTSSLVCLQGTGGGREVVAIRSGGAASAPRALDAADTRRHGAPHVGPDGTVLRAKRIGPHAAIDLRDAECTDEGECTGTIESGRDLVLRAEDAASGTERWTAVVPFRPADAAQCSRSFGTSWGSSGTRLVFSGQLAPDAFGGWATADRIDVNGCGIEAAVTPDGVVLGTDIEPGRGNVTSLGAAGYAATSFDGLARATLYAADGDVVGEMTGYPLLPWATDESGPMTLLGVDEVGRRLRAYDPDGTLRWDIVLQAGDQRFVAQVGDTAVVTSGAGSVVGLDLSTGEEEWTWNGSRSVPDGDGYFGSVTVIQAFTDGESVLLLTEGATGGAPRLVALDAASGAVVWDRPGVGAATTFDPAEDGRVEQRGIGDLVAVDGHLLEVTPRGVRGLG